MSDVTRISPTVVVQRSQGGTREAWLLSNEGLVIKRFPSRAEAELAGRELARTTPFTPSTRRPA